MRDKLADSPHSLSPNAPPTMTSPSSLPSIRSIPPRALVGRTDQCQRTVLEADAPVIAEQHVRSRIGRGKQSGAGIAVEIAEHGVPTRSAERNVAAVVAVDAIRRPEIRLDRLDQIEGVRIAVSRALGTCGTLRTCEVEREAALRRRG